MAEQSGGAVGELIRAARLRDGRTQHDVARSLGISRQWLQRLENGEFARPDAARLASLAYALQIPPHRMAEVSNGYSVEALPDLAAYLRAKFQATDAQIAQFERLGHVILRQVPNADQLSLIMSIE